MPIKFTTPEAESYYQKARAFEARAEWKKAADNFELAAEADSMHPEVWYRLGNARVRAQHPGWENHHNDDYFSAMDCDATTADEMYWQAKAGEAIAGWFNDETDEEAAAEYAARVALDPNNAEAWFAYGQAFGSRDERMMHCFNQALALDPDNRSYYFERAKLYRKNGCFKEALADYNKALQNERTKAFYYLSRGSFFVEYDHLQEAMQDYTTSLAIKHTTRCAKERGRLCLLAHDFEGALNGYGLTRRSYCDWREDGINIKYPAPGNAAADVRWEEAVQALERSGLIEATHPDYLKELCEHYLDRHHKFYSKPGPEDTLLAQYFSKPGPEEALTALAAADALVAARPGQPSFRELRIACQLTQPAPDMAALALDYEWLSQQP